MISPRKAVTLASRKLTQTCIITWIKKRGNYICRKALVHAIAVAHLSFGAAVYPATERDFEGEGGSRELTSSYSSPRETKSHNDAPNIVLIILDDVGFAATSTFGGPVETPELDNLASQGLKYNRFHVSALCSPTRAALLSGRNDHRAGFGQIMELTSEFPGYNGIFRKDTALIPDVLRRNGYSTAAFGKWHNTPYSEIGPIGPFDRWPTGLGFEYFYGFMGGMDSHWEPSRLYRNTIPVEPSGTPQHGYHLTTDLTDDAINWVRTHQTFAPDKPYFLYFATGATHSPHHAPREWIERFSGRFQSGWDKMRELAFARQKQLGVVPENATLTPRPKELRAWRSLSPDQKIHSAREMEVYAAFLAHTDYEVGRLLKAVRQGPRGNNTLVLYIVGDNGAGGYHEYHSRIRETEMSRGPALYDEYSAEWAWAMNTPFQWMKVVASHLGGIRNPLVISWPDRIRDAGGQRSQYTHVNDIAATLYDVAGTPLPSVIDGVNQQPLDGVSFAYSFDSPDSPSRHHLQIFEQAGNRSIYKDGWLAGVRHGFLWERSQKVERNRWELYYLENDFSQAHDLAQQYPNKLEGLQAEFEVEARKNNVYPLNPESNVYPLNLKSTAYTDDGRSTYVYYPGLPRIPAMMAPKLGAHSYTITADVSVADDGAQGVILSFGGRNGGFALYMRDGVLIYENQALRGSTRDLVSADVPLSRGIFSLRCEFVRQVVGSAMNYSEHASGTVRLYVNGQQVAERFLEVVAPDIYTGTLGIGQAFGASVSSAFQPPYKFSGVLEKVTVKLW